MHKALHVDVFESNNKPSLLAFSLCFQPLRKPVLEVLWKRQMDLMTLFQVLPPDLWEINATVGLVSIDQ